MGQAMGSSQRPMMPLGQPSQPADNTAFDTMRANTIAGLSAQQRDVYQQAQAMGPSVDPLAVAMGGPNALSQARMMMQNEPYTPSQRGETPLGSMPSTPVQRSFGPSIAQYGEGGEAAYNQQMQQRQQAEFQKILSLLMPAMSRQMGGGFSR
jgi:hypothetical protein